MTPKEKAKDLVDKYFVENGFCAMYFDEAKQCAIICVEEILKTGCRELPTIKIKGQDVKVNDGGRTYDNTEYWNKVKTEINKL